MKWMKRQARNESSNWKNSEIDWWNEPTVMNKANADNESNLLKIGLMNVNEPQGQIVKILNFMNSCRIIAAQSN